MGPGWVILYPVEMWAEADALPDMKAGLSAPVQGAQGRTIARRARRSKKGIGRPVQHGYFFVKKRLSDDSERQGLDVGLREDLMEVTPRLRRYARALATGGAVADDTADEIVHATLMRALGARHIGGSADLLVRLYATITQIHRDHALAGGQRRAATAGQPALIADNGRSVGSRQQVSGRQTRLSAGLLRLPLEDREALLLVGLEGFDHDEAARILRISRHALMARLTAARTALDASLTTRPPIAPRGAVSYLRLVT